MMSPEEQSKRISMKGISLAENDATQRCICSKLGQATKRSNIRETGPCTRRRYGNIQRPQVHANVADGDVTDETRLTEQIIWKRVFNNKTLSNLDIAADKHA